MNSTTFLLESVKRDEWGAVLEIEKQPTRTSVKKALLFAFRSTKTPASDGVASTRLFQPLICAWSSPSVSSLLLMSSLPSPLPSPFLLSAPSLPSQLLSAFPAQHCSLIPRLRVSCLRQPVTSSPEPRVSYPWRADQASCKASASPLAWS